MKLFENKKIKFVLISLIVLFFSYFFYTNFNEIRKVTFVNTELIIPISVLIIIFVIANGYANNILILKLGVKLPRKIWILMSIVNSLGNLVLPLRGGLASNAIYLKAKYNFNYKTFVILLYATYIILYSLNWFLAVITKIYVFIRTGEYSIPISISLIIVFLVLLIFYYEKLYKKISNLNILNKIKSILLGWSEIKKDRKLFFKLILVMLITDILSALILFLELKLIGVQTDFIYALFLSVIISFSLPFSVLPGNLGIKELFVIFSYGIVGITNSQAIIVSLFDRVINFILMIVIFIFIQIIYRNNKSLQGLLRINNNLASNNLPTNGI